MPHSWVRITQQPVDVIVDPGSGRAFVSERPGEPVGEAIGCNLCGDPMTSEYVLQPCLQIDTPAPA